MTAEWTELLKEVVYELLNSVVRDRDEQFVTCSTSTACSYISTVTFETWEQRHILQTDAERTVQIPMTEAPMHGYPQCREVTYVV